MESMKRVVATSATAALVLVLATGTLAQAADLQSEVEARYGRELLSTFEQMQSGVREPRIQTAPEASEPEARRFKNTICEPLDEAQRTELRNGLDAAEKGLHEWASGPTGTKIKEGLPLRLRR